MVFLSLRDCKHMTDIGISLCCRVVGELFGPLCSKVCYHLLREGELTFALIRKFTSLTSEEVRRCLAVLLHNRVISVSPGKVTMYNCNAQSALTFCFYKYYIALVKKLYGDICELLVEELLFMGQITYLECVERTVKRYNDVVEPAEALSIDRVKDKFTVLLREGIIIQIVGKNSGIVVEEQSSSPQNDKKTQKPSEDSLSIETIFELTTRRKRFRRDGRGQVDQTNSTECDSGLKRMRVEDPDIGLYYGIGHTLLARLFAEDFLVRLASEFFDPTAGRVLSAMYRIIRKRSRQLSGPLPGWAGLPSVAAFIDDVASSQIALTPNEIIREVNAKSVSATGSTSSPPDMVLVTVHQYLTLLSGKFGSVKFVTKVSENLFCCDMQEVFRGVCQRSVENVVEHRYGIKSLRIFRMILLNDLCDQKQMEQAVLMPVKECREKLYTLLTNGFVVAREGVAKGASAPGSSGSAAAGARFGTGRSGAAAAYTVEKDRVTRMLLEWTKKAMLNCIVRREFEVFSNKRVIDREKRVMDLLSSMGEEECSPEDRAALEEMLPPAERQLAATIRKSVYKLENIECQLVESLFVFETAARLYKAHLF